MKKFNDFEIEWNDWTTTMRVQAAARIFRCVLAVMDDLIFTVKTMRNGKTDFYIETTVEFDDWMAEFEKERGLLMPMHLPLKCPPAPWEEEEYSGYYTPRMMIPFIKVRGKDARAYVNAANPQQHKNAVNRMQRTPWQINRQVLEVQQQVFRRNLGIGIPSKEAEEAIPFPSHLADIPKENLTQDQKDEVTTWKMVRKAQYDRERQRRGQVIGFRQVHLLAEELVDWEQLYFAYNCDFRGRIYCATAGLSPQGADHAKGLLRFAEGVVLGKDGVKWLAIHGANVYGNDKITFDDRVKWVHENEPLIKAIVDDPISNRQWGNADKPYQFLAFCFEWANCDYGRNTSALGHIPVGLDGTCNGLQHFSAMLRDEVGAKATNLIDGIIPQDIYQEVADVATEKLKALIDTDPYAAIWLQVGINRKCAKYPVMTLPYGATQTSAREHVLAYVIDNWSKFNLEDKYKWEMVKYLTPILWASISEVVIAARAAMDWLQKNIGKGYCSWHTVIGFPVYQHYRKDNLVSVSTYLEGSTRCVLSAPDFGKGKPHANGQRNGIAPNFVHSVDSTHMVMTINEVDLPAYAMIHDDFGTHAGNTEQLFHAIRKTFKDLYTNFDPIQHWAEQVGANTEDLPRGTYDINDITTAKYFFG